MEKKTNLVKFVSEVLTRVEQKMYIVLKTVFLST